MKRVDDIWLAESDEENCKACGLRYFSECVVCKKLTCIWCGDDQVENKGVFCDPCYTAKDQSSGK